MTKDNHKKMTIEYNHLNLPRKITFDAGTWIEWTYDASGQKLRKKTSDNVTTNYINGIEYNGTVIEAIYHAEGRCTPQYNDQNVFIGYRYEYALRDHLGNTRVTFADKNNSNSVDPSEILQQNHYYPFGLNQEGTWNSGPNKYQYNGKELNSDFGLEWNDYGARWYDAAVGRWWVVDRKAGRFSKWSPYSYGLNNPIIMVDPNGMTVEFSGNGNLHLTGEDAKNYLIGAQRAEERRANSQTDGMAIFVAFPDANPEIPSNQTLVQWGEKVFGDGDGKIRAGHAGVVIINGEGVTTYFDFGRYDRPDIKKKRGKDEGTVRSSAHYSSLTVPNWDFSKTDAENTTAIMSTLHKSARLSGYGRIVGALAKGLDHDAMNQYARGAEYEGYLPFGGYSEGYDYCTSASYCAKFARAVGSAGGVDWDFDTFSGEGNVDDIVNDYSTTKIEIK